MKLHPLAVMKSRTLPSPHDHATPLAYILAVFLSSLALMPAGTEAGEAHWWRGNMHTHTLWSDGDDYPEMVAKWYKDNGYHFLVLSDHNVFQSGQRWTDIQKNKGGQAAFDRYLNYYGGDWVETKSEDGKNLVRLKPFAEFRSLLEEPNQFLMIPGEEITDRYLAFPIHMNFSNLIRPIDPQGGDNIVDIMKRNVAAVAQQRDESGQPMMLHLNHPNFGWGITAEELMQVSGEKFFEVYNGHPLVRDRGDEVHASTERVWDIILTWRLALLETGPVYGLATDDSHEYHSLATGKSNAGRGWVMVKAHHLTAENLILALEAGDFYASTGVTLRSIRHQAGVLSIEIEEEAGVSYQTEFIGTREDFDQTNHPIKNKAGEKLRVTHRYSEDVGQVLAVVEGSKAEYLFKGDEIYVRAKITSSKPKANGVHVNETETAWVQPVF